MSDESDQKAASERWMKEHGHAYAVATLAERLYVSSRGSGEPLSPEEAFGCAERFVAECERREREAVK